ncbi:MAG: dioxygenase [Pseudomonadota bacterium]
MEIVTTPDSVLPIVLKAMERAPDARLRTVMASLTRHLHACVQEVQLTEEELEHALGFLVGIGKATGDTKNEAVLLSDLLGVSTLVALINNQDPQGESTAALLGPFWRANAPVCAPGDNISRSAAPGLPLEVTGVVRGADGQPVADASVDVWQASPVGLYENQDDQQEDMNLRGLFQTDAEGRFHFRSVRPAGYPVPTDGPCGELLRAQVRHPNRPAHLHFMVSKPGYKVLISQIFADDDQNLESDPVFGVTRKLIGHFGVLPDGSGATLACELVLEPGEMKFPRPPIP